MYKQKIAMVELNQNCNLSCSFCLYNETEKNTDQIDLSTVKKIILLHPSVNTFIITGGEPSLNKSFFEILNYLKNEGIKAVVFTNGFLVSKEDTLEEMYSLVNRVYWTYHEYDYGITEKMDPYLPMKYISKHICKLNVTRSNINDIAEIMDIFIKHGAKRFSFNFIHNIKNFPVDFEITKNSFNIFYRMLLGYSGYIDMYNIDFYKRFYNNQNVKSTCLCGKNMIYISCTGNVYNCPIDRNFDYSKSYDNCKLFSNKCVSLWELFYLKEENNESSF